MSKENPLWSAPRIHGELLKLGFEIAESTVSKYMIRRRGPPSQTWRTFLRNHADASDDSTSRRESRPDELFGKDRSRIKRSLALGRIDGDV